MVQIFPWHFFAYLTMCGWHSRLDNRKILSIGRLYRGFTFVPVYDFQAFLMGCAFAYASIAVFAYCFMRYSDRLFAYYEILLAGSLIIVAISLGWCSKIFLTG